MSTDTGRLVGRGNTADIYEYGEGRVVKLFIAGFPSGRILDELNITQSVNGHFEFAPKAYGLVEIGGREGIIFERIGGGTMMDEMKRRLWDMGKLARRMAEFHLRIQKTCDFDIPTVKENLKRRLKTITLLGEDDKERIISYINSLPDGKSLCHFDFHPDNIMFRSGQPIIIDWMNAGKGDPLSDAARTALILKYSVPITKRRLDSALISRAREHVYKEYYNEYIRLSGATREDIQRWELPLAASRLLERVSEPEKKVLLALVKEKLM